MGKRIRIRGPSGIYSFSKCHAMVCGDGAPPQDVAWPDKTQCMSWDREYGNAQGRRRKPFKFIIVIIIIYFCNFFPLVLFQRIRSRSRSVSILSSPPIYQIVEFRVSHGSTSGELSGVQHILNIFTIIYRDPVCWRVELEIRATRPGRIVKHHHPLLKSKRDYLRQKSHVSGRFRNAQLILIWLLGNPIGNGHESVILFEYFGCLFCWPTIFFLWNQWMRTMSTRR